MNGNVVISEVLAHDLMSTLTKCAAAAEEYFNLRDAMGEPSMSSRADFFRLCSQKALLAQAIAQSVANSPPVVSSPVAGDTP